jgi:hypothetical protein
MSDTDQQYHVRLAEAQKDVDAADAEVRFLQRQLHRARAAAQDRWEELMLLKFGYKVGSMIKLASGKEGLVAEVERLGPESALLRVRLRLKTGEWSKRSTRVFPHIPFQIVSQ